MSTIITRLRRKLFGVGNRGEMDVWNLITTIVSVVLCVIFVYLVRNKNPVSGSENATDAQSVGVETESLTEIEIPQESQSSPVETKIIDTASTDIPPAITNVPDVWLCDLDYIKKGSVEIQNSKTGTGNTGIEYEHYMYSRKPYSEIVYYLAGKYDKMTAIWSLCYDNRNDDSLNDFDIYADNNLIYSSKTLTAGSLPEDISVDIKGCQILTIMFKSGKGACELGNIRLYGTNDPSGEVIPPPDILPIWLTDLDYLTVSGVYIRNNEERFNNIGGTYNHGIEGKAGSEIVYYLNGKYSVVSGIWCLSEYDKNTGNNCQFEIYADDTLVYSSPSITAGSLPTDFTVEINKCQMLKFVFTDGRGEAEVGNIRLYP